MKKVEVISFDISNDFNYPNIAEKTLLIWLETEEGKFIKQHSQTPIKIRVMNDSSNYNEKVEIWATLEEKIETFWRLKYK
jgi:hypothetical protein